MRTLPRETIIPWFVVLSSIQLDRASLKCIQHKELICGINTTVAHSVLSCARVYGIKCLKGTTCFFFRGESPDCRLFSTVSMWEWLRKLLPHHSQGSSTERWIRNTLGLVTARVFYVLGGL